MRILFRQFHWMVILTLLLFSVGLLHAQDTGTLVSEATEALAEAQYDAALTALEQAYTLDPDNYAVNFGLYQYYMQARLIPSQLRRENTERYLKRAIELEPASQEAQVELARWTRSYIGVTEALPILESVLAADPDNVPALLQQARFLLNDDRPGGQLALDRALELAPDDSETWVVAGLYALSSGEGSNRMAQIEALNRAIELNPRNWQAYSSRATAFWFTAQWSQMLQDLRVLEARWADDYTYGKLALAMRNLGMFQAGADAARQSIALSDSLGIAPNMVITNDLAENLIGLGDFAGAAAVWDIYYAVPENLNNFLNMDNAAMTYYRAGQFATALEYFERKSTEGAYAVYRDDHEAALEMLRGCAAADNCPLPENSTGLLVRGVDTSGIVGYKEALWSFDGAAGEQVSIAVTVLKPLTVALVGVSPDGTAYPVWEAQASASHPFALQDITLPADATYHLRITGDSFSPYRLYLINPS